MRMMVPIKAADRGLSTCLMSPSYLSWLLVIILSTVTCARAFSTTLKPTITVNEAVTTSDVVSLADLRYNEWMIAEEYQRDNENINDPPPSRYGFRMATAEVVAERSEAGAAAFLARLDDDNDETGAVGTIELSPIEFEGAIKKKKSDANDTDNDEKPPMLYLTDLVTSSQHRRMGIAKALMDAVELFAYDKYGSGTILFLHVKPDNEAALNFYSKPKIGYITPKPEQLEGIDVNRLEENAGTAGQCLLCKELITKPRQWSQEVAVGTGFGALGKATSSTKKSRRRKR